MELQFTGFVFKIQANMDPKHRDRDCILSRLLRAFSTRDEGASCCVAGREMKIGNALTFMANERVT